jgi:hypothetical protein
VLKDPQTDFTFTFLRSSDIESFLLAVAIVLPGNGRPLHIGNNKISFQLGQHCHSFQVSTPVVLVTDKVVQI